VYETPRPIRSKSNGGKHLGIISNYSRLPLDRPINIYIIDYTRKKEKDMTIQVQNVVRRLVARHGYSATFVQNMGEGIYLYSIGGIMYRIRGDGTIL